MGQPLPKQTLPRSEIRYLRRCTSFEDSEIQDWYQDFLESVDPSSQHRDDKYMTRAAFVRTYGTVFPRGRCEEFAGHVFRSFDQNGDRKLDFREFLVGLSFSGSEDMQKRLSWAFQVYDVSRSGFITLDNMTGIVRAVFQMIGPHALRYNKVTITAESLAEELFSQMDTDGDQMVSWSEFQEGVTRNPTAMQLLQLSPPDPDHDLALGGEEDDDEKKSVFGGVDADSPKCEHVFYR